MNSDVIARMLKFAFAMAVLGVSTIGICPAFAMMGIAVPLVLKIKHVELETEELKKKSKYSIILGIFALVFFVIDILLLSIFVAKK